MPQKYENKHWPYWQQSPENDFIFFIFRLQDVMFSVFRDRMNIRKEIMEMEGSDRDLTYRVYQKERCLNRIALLHSDTAATQKVVTLRLKVSSNTTNIQIIVIIYSFMCQCSHI